MYVKEMQIRPQTNACWIYVRLSGVPEFLRDGTAPIKIAERKSRALLAYLAVHAGAALSRDRLVELLWPDRIEGTGRASLRQALSSIRTAMGDDTSTALVVSRESVALQADRVLTDIAELEGAGDNVSDVAYIPAEFMDGMSGISTELDLWILRERTRLAALCSAWFKQRAERAETENNSSDAASYLSQALAIDPFDESLHRRLMTVLAASGRSDAALRQFETLASTLHDDLSIKPELATTQLAQKIRAGRMQRVIAPESSKTETAALPVRITPETLYAKSGKLSIAYQVTGSGPIDVVFVTGWVSNVDFAWKFPPYANFLEKLGTMCRLIRFDKRGTGLSDRGVGNPSLEERIEDVRSVMAAAGSKRAIMFGTSEGGNMCMLFAATYPDKAAGLVLYGSFAKGLWASDYAWAKTREQVEAELAEIEQSWGGPFDLNNGAPSLAADSEATKWFAEYMRHSASPQDAISLWRWSTEIDVRGILSAIRIPTLVMHRTDDRWVKVEEGRFLAGHIPNARFVEFPGDDHIIWAGDHDGLLTEVNSFLNELPKYEEIAQMLAVILMVSPEGVPNDVSNADAIRAAIIRHGGHLQQSTDGRVLALFDGPSKGALCGAQLTSSMKVRAVLHIGEIERVGGELRGTALDVTAAMLEYAEPGQLIVSQIVRDLMPGTTAFWGGGKHVFLQNELGRYMIYALSDQGISEINSAKTHIASP